MATSVFKQGEKIVLIGDSITSSGRMDDPELIGNGYFRMIRDYYTLTVPELDLQFFNKGIGGNRVSDLAARWQKDVIDLQPDWVSISIGINDVWRQLDNAGMEQIYPEQFEEIYRNILDRVQAETKAKLILMEPTIIEEDIQSKGNELLIPYVAIVRKLAETYNAKLVPTNQVFLEFLQKKSDFPLTTDGVHMTPAGNLLMAKTWIETITG